MDLSDSLTGHSSVDALRILHDVLEEEIQLSETKLQRQSLREKWNNCFLHHSQVHSCLHWTSCAILIVSAVILFLAYGLDNTRRNHWLVVEALLLLVILVINVYFLAWDDKLRQSEVFGKARRVLKVLNYLCQEKKQWAAADFIHLHAPLSPCVTVQWTLRDAELVNLPYVLLVEGDIIMLRPGQQVPTHCREVQYEDYTDGLELNVGDIYNPPIEQDPEMLCRPQAREPLKPRPFRVLETPFAKHLGLMLEKSCSRPPSVLCVEKHQIYRIWIERRFVPLLVLLMLIINTLRFVFNTGVGHWTEMFLVLQVHAIIPLTALSFPIMWKLLDSYGVAQLVAGFNKSKNSHLLEESDDFENESLFTRHLDMYSNKRDIWYQFVHICKGTSDYLPRTANLVHVLGNLTSFCCVDKKGVLSWPNPTAEKIFFLKTDNSGNAPSQFGSSVSGLDADAQSEAGCSQDQDNRSERINNMEQTREYCKKTNFEVLDLTQDGKVAYGLEFDDPQWPRHLESLKPLGLNILLNTCNMNTTEKYTEFANHVKCASLARVSAVPVVNRRCFCELAHTIGFSEQAQNIFKLQQVLGIYRTTQDNCAGNQLQLHSKSVIRYKMPMPNVFSVLMTETTSGMQQLFSQGTADLILDLSSDYWDGHDVCTLSDLHRKTILDFYTRTSLSSYCTAFSYRPMTQTIGSEFGNLVIVAPESTPHFPTAASPVSTRSWDSHPMNYYMGGRSLAYHGSADSLITGTSASSVHDIESCFNAQCNQIFIGLITMQYQVKQEIVKLIENLESACIRFVHFSKENELRSRVFSEKMGLEAGWNCHVSLLSEKVEEEVSPTVHADRSRSGNSTRPSRYSSRQSTESLPMQRMSHSGVSIPQPGPRPSDHSDSRRCSAPGAISFNTAHVKFEPDASDVTSPACHDPVAIRTPEDVCCHYSHSSSGKATFLGELPNDQFTMEITSYCSTGLKTEGRSKASSTSAKSYSHDENGLCGEQEEPLLDSEIQEYPHSGNPSAGEDGQKAEVALEDDDRLDDGDDGFSLAYSCPDSSHVTDNTDSMTAGLGLSNRAKLPKGIENIRPHIQDVDNVPLLVSLFTDCTPETTREMLSILQENGEVGICLGSSANIDNSGVFLQADCSLGMVPLYPPICMKNLMSETSGGSDSRLKPMEVSAMLNNIPCTLAFHSEDNVCIFRLLAQARYHCLRMRKTFLLLMMFQMTLTLVQLFSSIFLLPPVLSASQLLWMVVVILPILAFTMIGTSLEPDIAKMAQGKNKRSFPSIVVLECVIVYLIRYVPCIMICVLCHQKILSSVCTRLSHNNATCHVFFGDVEYGDNAQWNGWYADYSAGLVLAQNIVALELLLCFVSASLCYNHHLHHFWQKSPFTNKIWCIVVPTLLLLQVIYLAVDVSVENSKSQVTWSDIPTVVWVVTFIWPFVIIAIHELVKRREIKTSVRYQKRARLDFGTKLGMNSPF